MYFAKLVQNQTLRSIQQTTTTTASPATAIPVLLQPQATATGSAATGATATPATNPGHPVQPMMAPQQWAYAMATPTPSHHPGMLLAPQFAPQPVYVPLPPELYAGAGLGAGGLGVAQPPLGTSNLFDLRATLRALDNENADLPERMTHFDAAALAAGEYQAGRTTTTTTAPGLATTTTTTTATTSPGSSGRDKSARELSSTSSTLATSSLTFDKLPKTATLTELTELPVAAGTGTGTGRDTAVGIDDVVHGGGRPQMAAQLRRGSQQGLQPQDAWPNSRVTKVEHEKSPSVAGHNEPFQQQQQQPQPQQQHPQQQQQQQQHNFEAYFGELKIDGPWLPELPTSMTAAREPFDDKLALQRKTIEGAGGTGGGAGVIAAGAGAGTLGGLVGGISNDLLDEVKASRAALQKAAAAVDEHLARGNQLSPPTLASNEASAKPRVSIENIENAIYGERLTAAAAAATTTTAAAAAAAAGGAGAQSQGLFESLVTNAPATRPQHEAEHERERVREERPEQQQQQQDTSQIDYGQYDAISYGDPGEPSYASVESSQQQQQQLLAGEPLYSEIGNPMDYQQYATDATELGAASAAAPAAGADAGAVASETGGAEAEAAAAAAAQQEYSNMDYSNYDAGQYAAGYDPNAYPGYIYDEATGQYIADPNAPQYAPDGSYAGQDYDAGTTNYDYYAEQQQQEQQQQQHQHQQEQQEVGYPLPENNNNTGSEPAEQEVDQVPPLAEPSEASQPPTAAAPAASKPVKPTSILASTDKQAVPNDAHPQQQQQQSPHQQQQPKKKKRVNFVDSSETDDSSSAKPAQEAATAAHPTPNATSSSGAAAAPGGGGGESDFDFSTGSEAKN